MLHNPQSSNCVNAGVTTSHNGIPLHPCIYTGSRINVRTLQITNPIYLARNAIEELPVLILSIERSSHEDRHCQKRQKYDVPRREYGRIHWIVIVIAHHIHCVLNCRVNQIPDQVQPKPLENVESNIEL